MPCAIVDDVDAAQRKRGLRYFPTVQDKQQLTLNPAHAHIHPLSRFMGQGESVLSVTVDAPYQTNVTSFAAACTSACTNVNTQLQ